MSAVGEYGFDGGQFDVPAGGGLVQPLRRHGDAGQPAEDGAQRAGRLPLGREQAAQIAAEFLGEGEQGEGLRGGREIDDEQVVRLGEGGVAQGAQQRELLGAGERGDLLGVQAGGAQEVEDVGRAFLERGEVVPETGGGVGTPGGEIRGDPSRRRARLRAEGRAEGVGAVGAEDEGAGALRRAAASAVAAARVVRPLPPGPVIRMVRMGVNGTCA